MEKIERNTGERQRITRRTRATEGILNVREATERLYVWLSICDALFSKSGIHFTENGLHRIAETIHKKLKEMAAAGKPDGL